MRDLKMQSVLTDTPQSPSRINAMHKSWAPLERRESVMRSDSGLEFGSSSESASLTTEPPVCGSLWESPVPTKKCTVLFRSHATSDKVAEARTSGPLMQLPNGATKNLLVRGKEKVKQITRKMEGGSCLLMHRNLTTNKTLLDELTRSWAQDNGLTNRKDVYCSLKGMFNSIQFEGTFSNFQQLLSDGMFDSSESGQNHRVLQHFQKLLSLTDLAGSGWMEQCSQLQCRSKHQDKSVDLLKIKESSKENIKGFGVPVHTMGSAGFKCSPARLPTQTWGGTEEELMSHAGSGKCNGSDGNLSALSTHGTLAYGGFALAKLPECIKVSTPDAWSSSTNGGIELNEEGTCFISDGLLLADHGCGEGSNAVDDLPDIEVPGSDSTEPDLLFHIPSNMMFQQAELLHQPTCKGEINSNQVESESLIMSDIWHMDSCPSDWGRLFYNPSSAAPGCALPNGTVLNPGVLLQERRWISENVVANKVKTPAQDFFCFLLFVPNIIFKVQHLNFSPLRLI